MSATHKLTHHVVFPEENQITELFSDIVPLWQLTCKPSNKTRSRVVLEL